MMRVTRATALFSMIFMLVSSCIKTDGNNNCNYDACALKAGATEITNIENYLASQGITDAVKHCSGMYYKIKTSGTGAIPTVCSGVRVRYKGTFTNGSVFDQNQTTEGVSFDLSRLITGWKNGIPLLKAGGSMTLYVPPTLAYGFEDIRDVNGNIIMPKNSYLIFDIDLIAVQ